MLFKSMNLLKSSFVAHQQQQALLALVGTSRGFAKKTTGDGLSENFSFPKHKEFFND